MNNFLRGISLGNLFSFLLTTGVVAQDELLDSIVAPICHKHVSISVETHALRGAQLIGS